MIGLLVGVVIGVLSCLAALIDRMTPVPVTAMTPTPVILPVTDLEQSTATTVPITVVMGAPTAGVLQRSGVLTQMGIAVGDSLSNGETVAHINGHPVVAMVAPNAPYRNLMLGDSGPDVHAVQTWLRDLGVFTSEVDGKFGSDMLAAVKAWQGGVGETITGTFDLGSIMWVGDTAPIIGELSLFAGQSASPGDTLFLSRPAARSVTVTEPVGGIHQSGDQFLQIGGVSVAYVAGSGRVDDPEAVAQLTEALGLSTEGVGSVRPASPTRVKVLPAAAIVTDSQGRTCVFERVSGGPVTVTALGGGLGGVTVDESFPLKEVLANPTLVRSELSCG